MILNLLSSVFGFLLCAGATPPGVPGASEFSILSRVYEVDSSCVILATIRNDSPRSIRIRARPRWVHGPGFPDLIPLIITTSPEVGDDHVRIPLVRSPDYRWLTLRPGEATDGEVLVNPPGRVRQLAVISDDLDGLETRVYRSAEIDWARPWPKGISQEAAIAIARSYGFAFPDVPPSSETKTPYRPFSSFRGRSALAEEWAMEGPKFDPNFRRWVWYFGEGPVNWWDGGVRRELCISGLTGAALDSASSSTIGAH